MYNKYVKGERPLFNHLHGSSWHGDDAKSVLWILHHPIFLALLTLTGMLSVNPPKFSWHLKNHQKQFYEKVNAFKQAREAATSSRIKQKQL